MVNLIGSQIERYRKDIKLNKNEFFFDYLKESQRKKKNGTYNNFNLMLKSIEGNFDHPKVNSFLLNIYRIKSSFSRRKCSCLRHSWFKSVFNKILEFVDR